MQKTTGGVDICISSAWDNFNCSGVWVDSCFLLVGMHCRATLIPVVPIILYVFWHYWLSPFHKLSQTDTRITTSAAWKTLVISCPANTYTAVLSREYITSDSGKKRLCHPYGEKSGRQELTSSPDCFVFIMFLFAYIHIILLYYQICECF